MLIFRYTRNIVILSIISLLAGCSTLLNQKDPDVIVTTEPMLTKSEEGEVDKVTSADSINLDVVEGKGPTLGNNIIYFEYDKYSIENSEDKATVKKYSKYMLKYENATLRIEGHADERGSRAYNLALGEMQNYTPSYSYILGKGWKESKWVNKEKQEQKSYNPLNRLGVIDFKGVDKKYIKKSLDAITWLRDLYNSTYWTHNPPSNKYLYPRIVIHLHTLPKKLKV